MLLAVYSDHWDGLEDPGRGDPPVFPDAEPQTEQIQKSREQDEPFVYRALPKGKTICLTAFAYGAWQCTSFNVEVKGDFSKQ